MSTKYLDYDGLLYFWQKIKTIFAPLASPSFTGTPTGPTATAGDSSTQLATTAFVSNAVSSHTAGVSGVKGDAESTYRTGDVNITPANIGIKNYSTINVKRSDGTSIASLTPAGATDTLTFYEGDNVSFTATNSSDALGDNIHISATDTTYSDYVGATTSASGVHGLVPVMGSKTSGEGFYFLEGSKNTYTPYSQWFQPSIGFDTNPTTNLKRVKFMGKYKGSSNTYLMSSFDIPYASVSDPGFMSSTDKAKLDSIAMTNGIIDSSVLPSFVDDVIEAYPRTNQTELSSAWLATESASGTVITPETGKIYVLMADSTSYAANTQFRWGGTAYVKLADGGVSSITNAEIDVIVAS